MRLPTGRSLDVGVEALGIRTASTGVIAVTSFVVDLSQDTEIVFASLDEGHILDRVRVPLPMVRANFSPDGSSYAVGGARRPIGCPRHRER